MQRAIDGVPPLSVRDVVTLVVCLSAIAALTVVLRLTTPLPDAVTVLIAIAVVIGGSSWWSRRRKRAVNQNDDTLV